MNRFSALLGPDDFLLDLDVPDAGAVFRAIGQSLEHRRGLRGDDVSASLEAREGLGSTALGEGLAIPHARLPALAGPVALVVRTKVAVPFGAPDGKPVSTFFVLLVPRDANEQHLEILADAVSLLSQRAFRRKFNACTQATDMIALCEDWPARHAQEEDR